MAILLRGHSKHEATADGCSKSVTPQSAASVRDGAEQAMLMILSAVRADPVSHCERDRFHHLTSTVRITAWHEDKRGYLKVPEACCVPRKS